MLLTLVLWALVLVPASAQTTPPQIAPPPPQATAPVPSAPATSRGEGAAQSHSPQASREETHVTKQQAKELFRSVDEILQFVSHDSGLPIKQKVKRNLITREAVEKYVNKRMKEDKDTQRVEQSRLVLEKFGLIPRGYDLHAEFLRLLQEQVAAYYDPKTKSVNLLDWVPPDTQRPVLAHELTHALQDQMVDLEKWELAGAKDDKPLPDPQEYVVEEAQAARQCVTEGQAMITLLDYTLAPLGKTVLTAPEVADAMRAGMGDNQDSPVFAAAPVFLREMLMLPYTFGLDFVRAVLAAKGTEATFAGLLQNPPADTRQIMEPETYLHGQTVPPLDIPDLDKLVAPDFQRFDFAGMGEFDVYLLAKQYGADDAKQFYPHWRGGYYFAAHQKSAPKDRIAMMYVSRWDSPEAARDFAHLYAHYLPRRYKSAFARPATNKSGTPRNSYAFDTDAGKALVEAQGNDLLIMEGFDEAVVARARGQFLPGTSQPAQNPR